MNPPGWTPGQEAALRAGLERMEDEATVQVQQHLVQISRDGQAAGHCALGCLCAANPQHVRLVLDLNPERWGRGPLDTSGYAPAGADTSERSSLTLPRGFVRFLGLDRHGLEVFWEDLTPESRSLVQRGFPEFGEGQFVHLTALNDRAHPDHPERPLLRLPEIAAVLRDAWNLPRTPGNA